MAESSRKVYSMITGLGGGLNTFVSSVGEAGRYGLSAAYFGVLGLIRPKVYPRFELIRQIERTGVRSFPIIALAAALVGMTMVAQMAPTIGRWGSKEIVAGIVGVSILRTLGPVLTAIIFAGRVGAAFTAEIGTMKVGEELTALETMGISPMAYLVAPRVMAGTLMLMALTVVFDVTAMVTSYFFAIAQFGADPRSYHEFTHMFVDNWDFGFGVFKAMIFSFNISVICCYKGSKVTGGGSDVGKATMEAVVICLIFIILSDFILSMGYNVLVKMGLIPTAG